VITHAGGPLLTVIAGLVAGLITTMNVAALIQQFAG
jgi:hypothetical protein